MNYNYDEYKFALLHTSTIDPNHFKKWIYAYDKNLIYIYKIFNSYKAIKKFKINKEDFANFIYKYSNKIIPFYNVEE